MPIYGDGFMRKRRAMIFDDEPIVLDVLSTFFSGKGYEVHCFTNPYFCSMFNKDESPCLNKKPCADIVITDLKMPGLDGIALLEHQAERGCGVDIRNKALISGFIPEEDDVKVSRLGCAVFRKPFRLSVLSAWIDACEARMPISVALEFPRKEARKAVFISILYALSSKSEQISGVVTNLSSSGFCLTTDHQLAEKDLIEVKSDLPVSSLTASVCWTRKQDGRSLVAGLHCC